MGFNDLSIEECLTILYCFLDYYQPLRSPLTPSVIIKGIVPGESTLFKSQLNPLRLAFRTEDEGTCKVIFKKGDDLRQDQLVYLGLLHHIHCG